jgi:heptosyltransferase-2
MRFERVYVRAPNHLGDGVMARDAVHTLRLASESVVVAAPRWGAELYLDLDVDVVPCGTVPAADVAVLLAPSFRAAWEARRLPRRVGLSTDFRALLLTDRVSPPKAHRRDDYAALLGRLGLGIEAAPVYEPTDAERGAADVPRGHLALCPVSPSGPPVMWPGFEALAARHDGDIVFYVGPGEAYDTDHAVRAGLPLGALAAHLLRARALVCNDSGVAHFARAVGVPTVVIFGSTVPERTGPLGAVAVEGPSPPCRPCYKKRCRMSSVLCLEVPVDEVEAVLP